MRIAIGADHAGYKLKEDVKRLLDERHITYKDFGTESDESVDYPDFAAAVGHQVADGSCQAGIVVDAAGIGSAMAANKIPGVRCANCHVTGSR